MSEFIPVARTGDIPDGQMQLFEVDGRLVLIARLGDDFHCIDDVCTHDGGTLSDGQLEGSDVICPRHGARFDVRSGRALTMPATEDTASHQVQVTDGVVAVKLAGG